MMAHAQTSASLLQLPSNKLYCAQSRQSARCLKVSHVRSELSLSLYICRLQSANEIAVGRRPKLPWEIFYLCVVGQDPYTCTKAEQLEVSSHCRAADKARV